MFVDSATYASSGQFEFDLITKIPDNPSPNQIINNTCLRASEVTKVGDVDQLLKTKNGVGACDTMLWH